MNDRLLLLAADALSDLGAGNADAEALVARLRAAARRAIPVELLDIDGQPVHCLDYPGLPSDVVVAAFRWKDRVFTETSVTSATLRYREVSP